MVKRILVILCFAFLICTLAANAEEEVVTRAEYIQNIVQILGLETELAKDYTAKDCAILLNKKGFEIKNIENLNTPITSEEKSALINKLIGFRLADRKRAPEGLAEKAIVDEVKGNVEVLVEGTKKWIKAEKGMHCGAGDVFKTGPASHVKLRVGKFGRVTIKENSKLSLKELSYRPKVDTENIILNLAQGEVIVDVIDIKKPSRFEIRTPTTLAAVRGTIYSVKIIDEGKITLLE